MAKHEKTFVDFDKAYESNLVGLKGIAYFGIGLFLLIVITFGLMWFLSNVLEEQAVERDNLDKIPLAMSDIERVPPEPRLQAAPGFGIDSPQGRINLELKAPQSEYRALHAQWETLWTEGQKDPQTGTVVSMPIEQAKAKLLEQTAQTSSGAGKQEEQKVFNESRMLYSTSNAGRSATVVRR